MILFLFGFLILLILFLNNHNSYVQQGGARAEGLPCDPENHCRAGLECYGSVRKGVCRYPKDNLFGSE